MLGRSQLNSRPATLAEVKRILTLRSSETEFGYEQQASLDYVNRFCKLEESDANALLQQLGQIEGLSPQAAAKVVDVLPAYKSTLGLILAKDKSALSDSAQEQIFALVQEYRTKMIAPILPAPPADPSDEAAPAPAAAEPQPAADTPAPEPESDAKKTRKKPAKKTQD